MHILCVLRGPHGRLALPNELPSQNKDIAYLPTHFFYSITYLLTYYTYLFTY